MKNSRLINILRTLTKKEQRDLRKWLESPVHNQRDDVMHLFDYLRKKKHLEEDKFLLKERVFSKIYPKENFDDAKLRQSMFFLLKQIENFLIFNELMEDEVRAKTTLASVYRKRGLDKACEKNLRTIEELQQKQPYRNEQFLRNEYLLQRERYAYLSGFKRIELNLQQMSDALDTTFFADKLRQACLMFAHQNIYKKEYTNRLIEEVIDQVEKNDFLQIPAIALYYYVLKTLLAPEEEHYYYKLKEVMDLHLHIFPEFEARNMYLMAINYCIKRTNLGHRQFIKETFNLILEGCKNNALIENGTISKMTFLNLVINGNLLQEFDEVESFINNYQKYLEPSQKDNIVIYSLASLFYRKGD